MLGALRLLGMRKWNSQAKVAMLVKDNVYKAAALFHDDDITRPHVMHRPQRIWRAFTERPSYS
jgi:hypothetical protein